MYSREGSCVLESTIQSLSLLSILSQVTIAPALSVEALTINEHEIKQDSCLESFCKIAPKTFLLK